MTILATWLLPVLRAAGVQVVEYPGWKSRTRPGKWLPRAVMWHHDASGVGPSPAMPHYIAETGRPPEVPAPLAQCWVDTMGRWHLLAAGRANHAGDGGPWGVIPEDGGNTYSIGVETDHTIGEPWYRMQLDGLERGTAAILGHLGAQPNRALVAHREYAPGRKFDPAGLDMAYERDRVARLMLAAAHPAPPPPPPTPPLDLTSGADMFMVQHPTQNDRFAIVAGGRMVPVSQATVTNFQRDGEKAPFFRVATQEDWDSLAAAFA